MSDQSPTSSTTTQTKPFPGAFELFSASVTAIGKNVGTFIGLLAASLGLIVATSLLATIAILVAVGMQNDSLLAMISIIVLVSLAIVAACIVVLPYFTYLQLRSSEGKQLGFKALLQETKPYFWRLLGLRLLLGIIYFFGLILFVVPFFFLWKRYMLSRYYIVAENMDISQAMTASARDSETYADAVWGVVGVRTLWWFVSQIFGFVGSIVDFLYSCAPSLRYLQIKEAKHNKAN